MPQATIETYFYYQFQMIFFLKEVHRVSYDAKQRSNFMSFYNCEQLGCKTVTKHTEQEHAQNCMTRTA